MKKLVKVFALALVALMLVTPVFAGGSKDSAASGKTVLKVMAYGDNANQEGQTWVRVVKEFEAANPDIKIEFEMLFDEAYHQKVVARLASGDFPHFAYMGADARWGAPWSEANQRYDMRQIMNKNYYDLTKIPVHGANGEIFFIPLGTTNACTVMFINTKLMADLGLTEPKTYADMVAMVPKAKAAGVEVLSTHGADSWAWGSCVMSSIVPRVTGDPNWIQKATNGQKKFTDPDFVASLAVLSTMVKDGVLSSKTVMYDAGAATSNFSNNKVLIHIGGQWEAGGFSPDVQKTMKMVAFPEMPGEKGAKGTVSGAMTSGYGITKFGAADAKIRDASMKFIDFFNSEKEVVQRWRDGNIVAPVLKTYKVPADLPAAVIAKAGIAAAPTADVIDAFLSGPPNDHLNAGMQSIVLGNKTATQVADEVEKLMKR